MGLIGLVLSLHPIHLLNLFIAAPIMTEGWEKFCFRETKKRDFWIFTTNGHEFTRRNRKRMFNHRWTQMNTDKNRVRIGLATETAKARPVSVVEMKLKEQIKPTAWLGLNKPHIAAFPPTAHLSQASSSNSPKPTAIHSKLPA